MKIKSNPKNIPRAKIILNPGFLVIHIIGTTTINAKTSIRHGENTPAMKKVNGTTNATRREFETLCNPCLIIEFSIISGRIYKNNALKKNVINPIIVKTGTKTVI